MISALFGGLLMDDSNSPLGDKAIFAIGEGFGLALMFYAVDHGAILAGVVGAGLMLLGVFFPTIRRNAGPKASAFLDRLVHNRKLWKTLSTLLVMAGAFWVLSYVHQIRSDLDSYVLPRHLTEKQASAFEALLSKNKPFRVTVQVAVHDAEALQYAGEIFNAFKKSGWDDAIFHPTETAVSEPPYTLNDGMCIEVVGTNAGPPDPKHDPAQLLGQAFQSAHIEANCGGGIGAGNYEVFVAVGHRPLKIGDQEPILSKLGRWIERMSYK